MVIYQFTNKLDGKMYIGQTTTSLKKRLSQHYSTNKDTYFYRALRKYGKENFIVEEICSATNIDDLNYLEEYFIQYYNTLKPNGYNIALGGDNFERICGPMQGKKHTEETKQKMSLSALGKPKSQETKEKISQAKKGSKLSQEARDKISKVHTGMKYVGVRIVCNETSEIFISILEASRSTGIYRTKINRQLTGKVKNTKCPLTFRYINK